MDRQTAQGIAEAIGKGTAVDWAGGFAGIEIVYSAENRIMLAVGSDDNGTTLAQVTYRNGEPMFGDVAIVGPHEYNIEAVAAWLDVILSMRLTSLEALHVEY